MASDQQNTPKSTALTDVETLELIAADGVSNRLTLSPAAHARAITLLMPAMGVRAEFCRPYAQSLAQAGMP